MSKPIAVLISDVHYSLQTLELADKATRMAIGKANQLGVPLIVAGDLHDTKANLRGECIRAIIETFKRAHTEVYVMIGNHDKINEKSEDHSLSFLEDITKVVDHSEVVPNVGLLLPYYADKNELTALMSDYRSHTYINIIMHQGIQGSYSGDYFQDKSALSPADVAGRRIISGHYHRRQTIKLPDGGSWDYIGNPYTLNYGEANDPPKGFQILMDDGSLEFVPTNLREHHVVEGTVEELKGGWVFLGEDTDIVKVKLRGTKEELAKITKSQVAYDLDINQDFKLELIPTDSTSTITNLSTNQSQEAQLDSIIDTTSTLSAFQKARLKTLWKDLK